MNLIPFTPFWTKALAIGLIKPVTKLDLSKRKTDTCFVLGSGPSINLVSPAQWERIARADTVGFNFWADHRFVPDLYGCESVDGEPFPPNLLISLTKRLHTDYADVPILLKDGNGGPELLEKIPERVRRNFFMSREFLIDGSDLTSLFGSLSTLRQSGFFDPGKPVSIIPKRRSSIAYHLCLAIMRGFRNVVLLGVDLTQDNHFNDFPLAKVSTQAYYPEDPKYGPPVSMVLQAITQAVATPMGVNVFVGSPTSKLASFLPLWTDHLEVFP